ncbi:MAG TPA: orotidine-5'-phosphate decarboxylase, partial [Candidatus Krumholzibacterium sp.]|nr:orotidine-5'-phosphate decarboxylase [Candidatus Krumholzibacterium sp.]
MQREARLIAALDVEERGEALELVSRLEGVVDFFKLGSRLFTAEGPDMIRAISTEGASIFLDLKFHDIPATVAGSVKAACVPGVDMMTIHTCGGVEMMRAAAESASETSEKAGLERPVIVGVTVLTSMSAADLEAVSCYGGEVRDLVLRRAA